MSGKIRINVEKKILKANLQAISEFTTYSDRIAKNNFETKEIFVKD